MLATSSVPTIQVPASHTLSAIFNDRSDSGADLYAQAKRFAGIAYYEHTDKGSSNSIWHHVDEVKERVKAEYAGRLGITDERLMRLKALAVMHEVLELKDAHKNLIYTPDDLRKAGFDEEFVLDCAAMCVRPGHLYLDEIHLLAQRPNAVLVKKCDVDINSSPRTIDPRAMTDKLRDKKAVLYPATSAFLGAIINGEIRAPYMSVKEYAMGNRYLPDQVRNQAVLDRHSSDGVQYARPRSMWPVVVQIVQFGKSMSAFTGKPILAI